MEIEELYKEHPFKGSYPFAYGVIYQTAVIALRDIEHGEYERALKTLAQGIEQADTIIEQK